MVVTCQIDFDNNPYGTYFAGQVVTGKVTLTVDKPKQVKGVALNISGYAHTRWTERSTHHHHHTSNNSHHSSSHRHTTSFRGREDYIASLTYLLGSEADQSLVISPGIHTYNFACHIPVVCPSSFEGTHGHIRYIIKIALKRPWKFDQTFTKGFTVIKFMDLNYDSPLLRIPTHSEVQKTFCCGPCSSDPMTIQVSLAQSGFVPGQNIPITVTVTNDSNIPVEEIKVSLVMLVCYYSQTPRTACKNETIPMSKLKGEGVLRHCKKMFNYELPVPATPPTCFNLCRIIQIAYEVFVEAKVKGMHSNQVIGVPITIGNVPLIGVIQQQPIASTSMQRGLIDNATAEVTTSNVNNIEMKGEVDGKVNENVAPTAPLGTEFFTPWESNANIPPPNYEEAMHVQHGRINEDEMHDFGESDFAPRYPVFNLTSAPAALSNSDEIEVNKTTNGTWI